eukprot:TRINITY_DN16057_c0_g1_i2.p1 TRINITY_DN16057_c0_g1~~TRINITY_DN16057_c0_g1_i2.p1  ORF type:complete len:187 (-),score=45.70 TRINITY_DN16057_c0_g1_i2:264-824(-)
MTFYIVFFLLMIRRPPRSTQGVSSAASDVYKRQVSTQSTWDEKKPIFQNHKLIKTALVTYEQKLPSKKGVSIKAQKKCNVFATIKLAKELHNLAIADCVAKKTFFSCRQLGCPEPDNVDTGSMDEKSFQTDISLPSLEDSKRLEEEVMALQLPSNRQNEKAFHSRVPKRRKAVSPLSEILAEYYEK